MRSAYAGDPRLIDAEHLATLRQLPRGMELAPGDAGRDDAYGSFEANASREQRAAFAQFVRRQRRWLLPYGLFELCSARFGGRALVELARAVPRRRPAAAARVPRRGSPRVSRDRVRAISVRSPVDRAQALRERSRRVSVRRPAVLRGSQQRRGLVDRATCSRSTRTATRAASRACRRTTSTTTASSGATRSTTGTRCAPRLRLVARAARGAARAASTSCASTTSALSSRIWEVRAGAQTAREGAWRPGRGTELLTALRAKLGEMPLVAEDFGIITDEVRALRDGSGCPAWSCAVRVRRPRRQPVPARESRPELRRVHRHARQRHDGRLVGRPRRGARAGVKRALGTPASRRCPTS